MGPIAWQSSSAPAGGAGALFRTTVGERAVRHGWIDSPEDMAFDTEADVFWSLSEAAGARYVIAVARTAID